MTLHNMRSSSTGRERVLLWCGVIGPALFIATFLVAGTMVDDYDPLRHPVSSLVLSEIGWVQVTNFLTTGALILAFGRALGPLWRRQGGGIWAPRLIGLVGVGLIGSGLFATDPISGYPPGTPMVVDITLVGRFHRAFGAPIFLGLPAACGVVAYHFAKRGRTVSAIYSGVAAVVLVTGLVLFNLGFSQHPLFMPIGGLLQRVALAIGLTWIASFALILLYRPAKPPGSD